MLFTTTESALI